MSRDETIRQNMPEETMCRYCQHSIDINETVCKANKQSKTKERGLIIVLRCTGFDAINNGDDK